MNGLFTSFEGGEKLYIDEYVKLSKNLKISVKGPGRVYIEGLFEDTFDNLEESEAEAKYYDEKKEERKKEENKQEGFKSKCET